MSHISTVELEIRDPSALEAACRRLSCSCELNASAKLYSGQVIEGHVVKLASWNYPVVFSADGKCHFDNYEGRWGDIKQLNRLKQAYATEVAKRQAIKGGFRVQERSLPNGSVQLVLSK